MRDGKDCFACHPARHRAPAGVVILETFLVLNDLRVGNNAGLLSLFLHIGASPIIGPADHVVQDRSRAAHEAINLKTGDEVRRDRVR